MNLLFLPDAPAKYAKASFFIRARDSDISLTLKQLDEQIPPHYRSQSINISEKK